MRSGLHVVAASREMNHMQLVLWRPNILVLDSTIPVVSISERDSLTGALVLRACPSSFYREDHRSYRVLLFGPIVNIPF